MKKTQAPSHSSTMTIIKIIGPENVHNETEETFGLVFSMQQIVFDERGEETGVTSSF
jgi:hypothetical protein